MNTRILTAALVIIALFASCNKASQRPMTKYFINAVKQDINWVAQPTTSYAANHDTLVVRGYRTTGEEQLVVKIRFNGQGIYKLTGNEASFYTTLGQDALTSQYSLDNTFSNTFVVTSYNATTKTANGTFQLYFVKIYGDKSFADTLRFTSGQFSLPLPNN